MNQTTELAKYVEQKLKGEIQNYIYICDYILLSTNDGTTREKISKAIEEVNTTQSNFKGYL